MAALAYTVLKAVGPETTPSLSLLTAQRTGSFWRVQPNGQFLIRMSTAGR
jgi:hypothetical protein